MTTTNTCNSTFKIKIPSRFDEKDQVEGADETKQNAENVLTAITCVNLPKIKTVHRFDEVTAERDKTEELYVEQQNAVHTALASHKYFENNNNTGLKKISVQAFLRKTRLRYKSMWKASTPEALYSPPSRLPRLTSCVPEKGSRSLTC